MPGAPRDGVALTADVEHCPAANSPDRSGCKLINGSDEFLRHGAEKAEGIVRPAPL